MKPLAPTVASEVEGRESVEWEADWARCVAGGQGENGQGMNGTGTGIGCGVAKGVEAEAFRPGSLEGVWEGLFTVRSGLVPTSTATHKPRNFTSSQLKKRLTSERIGWI